MKKTILHESNAYLNRYEYRAIEQNGVVKIQQRRASDPRWFTKRTMDVESWKKWEATANLSYNSLALYDLIDFRSSSEIANDAYENRGR